MGLLIDGQWHHEVPIAQTDEQGRFIRPQSAFRNWVSSKADAPFPAQANRYHLYISYACPWAHGALIMRQLKGLDQAITMSTVHPLMLDNGWEFGDDAETQDPCENKRYLRELYQQADPQYTGKVTVPVLWDKQQQTIVNNESMDIIHMFNQVFQPWAQNDYDAYPAEYQAVIDQMNDWVYQHINNGVYRCGFAQSQAAYDQAFDELFQALEQVEACLQKNTYLVSEQPTLVDWRLFATLIRFDLLYYSHFKCNYRRIKDYPLLRDYLKRLYYYPNVADTVQFDAIKTHYFASHKKLNPSGIIPKGPDLDRLFEGPI